MIQSLAEAEQALMRECSDRAAPDCHKSVRPIYANTRREPRPKHSGSCTLLEIDGVRVLVTAAHIADEIGKGVKLYVGGPLWTRLVPIRGCLLYTSDAADDLLCVDLGGRRIIKKKT